VKAEDTDKLDLLVGRDADGGMLHQDSQLSTTVVRECEKTRRPVLVTGSEEGELLGSQSAIAQDLRSIMASPLLLGNRLIGVLYLDSRLARGMFSEADLELLAAVANQVAAGMESARAARLEIERQALDHELALSGAVQRLLLPTEPTYRDEKLELHGFYRPAARCGGDWWWYERDAEGGIRILVGDVVGHGAAPAMVTAMVASVYRASPKSSFPEQIQAVHDDLLNVSQGAFTVSLTGVCIAPDGRKAQVFSAGGPPVGILGARDTLDACAPSGTMLGSGPLEIGSAMLELNPGDRLVLSSDGVFEMRGKGKRALGLRRLLKMVSGFKALRPAEAAAATVEGLDAFRGELPQDDDVTFVLVDIL
jgi:serine phosphatase RsbU (regulator of sigma subunit)